MPSPQDNLEIIQSLEAKVKQLTQELQEKEQELEQAQTEILNQKQTQIYELSYKRMAHDIKNKIGLISYCQEDTLVDLQKIKNFLDCYIGLFEELDLGRDTIESIIQLIDELKSDEISSSISLSNEILEIIEIVYYEKSNPNLFQSTINIHKLFYIIIDEITKARKIDDSQLTIKKAYEAKHSEITCISTQIEKALANIIDNAFSEVIKKFTHSDEKKPIVSGKPVVTIMTENQDNLLLIKIKDNGRGIKPEDINKIFDSFWTTKSSGEGMGLGLYIAKEIIEQHGGSITVESEPEAWTEFTVTLPLSQG